MDPVSADHDQALMDLAQILAHRLRSLVASIEGFTDLLTDTLATKEQREMALRIFEGAIRIERVLADLQVYSQRVEPLPIPLRVAVVLDDVLAVLEEGDGARIGLELEDVEAEVLADPHLLRQALLVLLQNALDATRHGGAVRIRVLAHPTEDAVCFEVWNEGWIALEEAAQRVFMPFFTTKAQNLGVGLSIARRIAETHAGSLELTGNGPREGTCFTLVFPAPEAGRQPF